MKEQSIKTAHEGIKRVLKHIKIYQHIHHYLKSKVFRYSQLLVIIFSISAIVISSFSWSRPYRTPLFSIIYFSAIVFTVEYILRIITAPANHPEIAGWKARLRYIFSFYGFVDFVAMLPFLLVYFYWNTNVEHLIVLPYIFMIFKLIRYSQSFRMIGEVLKEVRGELATAYTACGILIGFSAILMYYIERGAQPDAFGNIGDGLWWSIVAFTTVGYGDLYPITALGRILSSVISLVGIAMIALPTGIISSAFLNVMEKKRKERQNKE